MPTGTQNRTPAPNLARLPDQAAPLGSRLARVRPEESRQRSDDAILLKLTEYRKTGRAALRDEIVMHYAGLVESIARRFCSPTEPAEDLAQEGYIGLITAVDLYDPTKKVKFSTYATHFVMGQIKHYLRDRGKIIKEPAWLQELNGRITRAINALAQQLQRPPSYKEIAEFMDMTEQAVADLMMTREVFKVASIDGSSNDNDDDSGALDMDRQKGGDPTVTFHLSVEERIVMEAALHKLKELEKKVVTAFYFRDLNQTEIAKQLGISCNYVSHILRNSTKKLKKIMATDEIRDAQLALTTRRRVEETGHGAVRAIVDETTRLYNHHYFETRLEEELSRASRMGTELAVVFVQIGGWTRFERGQGTLKADEAIQALAQAIVCTVRRTDIVTRYSEDTFAVILPHTGATAEIVCERLREALTDKQEEKGWTKARTGLAFGFGNAVYPRDAVQPILLTESAQERLTGPSPLALAA